MDKQSLKQISALLFVTGLTLCASIVVNVHQYQSAKLRHDPNSLQPHPVAMVLGASIKEDGTASDALYDRVSVGIDLYKLGKVEKILLTGDDGRFRSNEIAVMKQMALDQGVPESAILTDGQGYRTYESCKRAVTVFQITDAVVITQEFHLRRALYLCSHLGMTQLEGLTADRHRYANIVYFTVRDTFASVKAWIDIHLIPPTSPVKS